jgi:uracil phosphoribosyltransferase
METPFAGVVRAGAAMTDVDARLFVSTHPLVRDKVTALRDLRTEPAQFRALTRELSWLLGYEALAGARLRSVKVRTPLAETTGEEIADDIGLVPILRAGISMAEGVLQLLPRAQVWHLGIYRDHATRQPVTYYNRIPAPPRFDLALVLDPMLATGGSAVAAVQMLHDAGIARVVFVGLIGAPEGVARLRAAFPDLPIYLAALDDHLNEQGYIVPGLGDAGDRQFYTA